MTARGYDADVLPAMYADDPAGWTSRTRHCVDCGCDFDRTVNRVCPLCDGGDAPPTDAAILDKRRELEARVGVDYLDVVQAARAAKVREAAPLRALRDTFDARRKAERGKVLALLNAERAGRGEKDVPATLAETLASGDPRYVAFLDDAALAFARLAILEDEIQACTEIVNRGQMLGRYASSEPKV